MKRKQELKQRGLNPKPNGDWVNARKTITSKDIRNANGDDWQRLLYHAGENKHLSILEYLKRNPYDTYWEIMDFFNGFNSDLFDKEFEKAFVEWRKVRGDYKFMDINVIEG